MWFHSYSSNHKLVSVSFISYNSLCLFDDRSSIAEFSRPLFRYIIITRDETTPGKPFRFGFILSSQTCSIADCYKNMLVRSERLVGFSVFNLENIYTGTL